MCSCAIKPMHYPPLTEQQVSDYQHGKMELEPRDVIDTLRKSGSAMRCVVMFFAYTSGLIGALFIKEVIERVLINAENVSSSVKWRTVLVAFVVVGIALLIFCGTRINMHGQDVDKVWEKRFKYRR